ncbi:hypothetical protein M1555_01610 [Patescibacteria group bacterium]|nr:hypothetical protein [Patescibacteria group bacterium]
MPDVVREDSALSEEESQYQFVALAAQQTFIKDGELVRESAEHHGVQVTEGGLFVPASPGNYNLRLPDGSPAEIKGLRSATRLLVVCEDCRVSGPIAKTVRHDALFANAGGPGQILMTRIRPAVQFTAAVLALNPNISIVWYGHTGICGGANHQTNGRMADFYNPGEDYYVSEMKDSAQMEVYLQTFMNELMEAGFPREQTECHLVHVNEENGISGITTVEF